MTALHGFYRSSASFRVRIALNLKGIAYDTVPYDIAQDAHRDPAYLALNPQGLLPTLAIDGLRLTQSLAIVDYLEATRPAPPLYPADPAGRARVASLAAAVGSDIHPLGAARAVRYLRETAGLDAAQAAAWQRHWIETGFAALETRLQDGATGRFSHGDAPGVADLFLVPQAFTARRVGVEVDAYPTIAAIVAACLELPAFRHAHPDNQPDSQQERRST
ncbi:maleylacetoacetate isomerase [Burkholderia gladioli]|uniref:maleylacetoacetate isomerase n=1 Tax=Burkholderia gladioli TaxID=28095 RepID=UPI000CFE69A9|nr:maleylacetoacetate isomerase [Burkholderia gladioli]MBJ9660437.1 maleylacetoacetate isomerase [Burkholderia gladioli]PRE89390.1 maleylacetoacetate isomerase [Burkholderia gladioli]